MLTLARLHQFVSLAEHESIGKAAAALKISQPALTKSVHTLERTLGVALLDRHSRGVVLTEFGRLVVSHSRTLIATESELFRDIRLLAGLEVGHIDVWLGPYPSAISGYAAAGKVMAAYPKLRIALHVANWRAVTAAVREKQAEFGIAELTEAVLDEQFATDLVGKHRARIFCRPGHPLLTLREVSLPSLLEFPWAHTRIPPRLAAAFPRDHVRAGHIDEATGDFVPAIEVDVPMQLAKLVEGNDAIAFGAFTMVEADLEAGRLVYLPTPRVDLRGSYGFIALRNRSLSRAALAYMEAVREEERACAEREARLEQRFGQREPWPANSVTMRMKSASEH